SAPWWASVIAVHGVGPFIAARASGGSLFSVASGEHASLGALWRYAVETTGEGMFPLILVLAIVGAIWCVRERRAFLPIWWLCILILDPRAGSTYASAPVAMLAGTAVVD